MKTLKISLLLLLVLSTACSNDDDSSENITSDDLSGTWISTGATFDGAVDYPVESEVFNVGFTGQSTASDHTLIFSETSDLYASEGSYDIELTFSVFPGVSQTEAFNDIEFLGAGTWNRNGNTLRLTIEGEDTVFQITTLTENELIIETSALDQFIESDLTIQNLEGIFRFRKQ